MIKNICKIKFNSDDDLPLNETLKLCNISDLITLTFLVTLRSFTLF